MFLTRLCVWYLFIKILINGEIITLIYENQNVTCIATGDNVNSTVYLENVPLQHFSKVNLRRNWKSWNKNSRLDMGIIKDQRWRNFTTEKNKLYIPLHSNSTSFSFCGASSYTVYVNNKTVKSIGNQKKSTEEWTHYNLEITEKSHIVIKDDKNARLNIRVDKNISNITLVSTHPSSWKLHKLFFKEARKPSNKNTKITVTHTGNLQLSMFAYLESNSNLHLHLTSHNHTINRTVFGADNPNTWKQITMEIDSINTTTLLISRILSNTDASSDGYWAIDEVNFYTNGIKMYTSNLTKTHQIHACKILDNSASTKANNKWPVVQVERKCETNISHYEENESNREVTKCSTDGCAVLQCSDKPVKPTIINISDNIITVNIENLTYCLENIKQEYIVQYRKMNEVNFKNINITQRNVKKITITRLNTIENQYEIKIILVAGNDLQIPISTLITYKRSLKISSKLPKNISLSWMYPKSKNYIIDCQCFSKFCNELISKKLHINKQNYKITQSTPLTNCSVRLYDSDNVLIDVTDVNTKEVLHVNNHEFPVKIEFSQSTASFEFSDCEYFDGPLSYNFTFDCISQWCDRKSKFVISSLDQYKRKNSIKTHLAPFTEYNVTVTAYRLNATKAKSYGVHKTPPGKPKQVRNLTISCRNGTTLWIKWEAPHRLTGEILRYQIKYGKNNGQFVISSNTSAIIPSDSPYNITVQAKNKNVTELVNSTTISSTITNIDLQKPKILSLKLRRPNGAFLTWNHARLTDFFITVSGNITKNYTVKSHKCQETYNHKIQLDYTENCTIKIWGVIWGNNTKKAIISTTSRTTSLSSLPLITWCLEEKCTLLVPKPEKADRESNFSILIKNETDERLITHLKLEDNYFQLEKNEVPLDNKSYEFFLKTTDDAYPFFEKFDRYRYLYNTAALSLLGLVFVVTILFLGYLCYAYKSRRYPFELRNKIRKIQKTTEMEIKQFSPYFLQHNIKTVRNKQDLPFDSAEKEALLESSDTNSVPVRIDDFENYLMVSLGDDPNNNDLTRQFEKIPRKINPHTISLQKKNVDKNRYRNLTAFDDTRVKLKDNDNCDYINANYVDGYEYPKAFIATQAPMDSTLGDFWWMIWQENVTNVIMLTELVENGIVKCVQYWPLLDRNVRFGKILIKNISEKFFADFTHRQLSVHCNNQTRIIQHFQYTTWPDHGVPQYPQNFTDFIKKLLAMPQCGSPIIVHCNAGCGRTGTLILCDRILRMAARERKLDFVKTLNDMREQRVNLVTNVNQYVFAHFIVLECLFGVDFSIPINDNLQNEIHKVLRKTTVKPLMDQLDKVMMQFKKRQTICTLSMTDEDKMKNRCSQILPENARIYLPVTSENSSNYINAVTVDCFRCPKKFIVTQQPLPNTVDDFWRMIKEFEINTIVSLNEIENNPRCPKFWSQSYNKYTKFEELEEHDNKVFSTTKFKISDTKNKTIEKTVNVLKMKEWQKETPKPKNPKDLIVLWKAMFDISWKGNSQILITCYDGATASGLFVALAFLLEKINFEQTCDVFSAIRTVRQSREQFVQEWGQIEFLYKAAQVYIEEFDNYDNFNN